MAVILAATLAAAVVFDLRERRIPNAVTAPAAIAALFAGAAQDPARLAAGAGAAAFLALAAVARPDGMGWGDVKLAGVLGLLLGPPVAMALFFAFSAGTLYGVALALRRGLTRARRTTVPFAPFLALGAVWVSLVPP